VIELRREYDDDNEALIVVATCADQSLCQPDMAEAMTKADNDSDNERLREICRPVRVCVIQTRATDGFDTWA